MFHGANYEIPYRRKFKMNCKGYRINAVPRDVGEIPRKYVLRYLFLHQPITFEGLWNILKKQSDVPLDSMRHMRAVLRIARDEDWVYIEKDQDSNDVCLHIKHDKYASVQELVQKHSEEGRITSEKKIADDIKQNQQKEHEISQINAEYLKNAYHELVQTAEKLKKYDIQAFHELPYVTKDGSYDFFWYKKGAQANAS